MINPSGYVYQMKDGSFIVINMRAAVSKIVDEFKKVDERASEIVVRWVIKKRNDK